MSEDKYKNKTLSWKKLGLKAEPYRTLRGTSLTIFLLIKHWSLRRTVGSHPLLPLSPVKHWCSALIPRCWEKLHLCFGLRPDQNPVGHLSPVRSGLCLLFVCELDWEGPGESSVLRGQQEAGLRDKDSSGSWTWMSGTAAKTHFYLKSCIKVKHSPKDKPENSPVLLQNKTKLHKVFLYLNNLKTSLPNGRGEP